MFNLAPKYAIGFTTRIRGFVDIDRIHRELYKTLSDDDATENGSSINPEHLNNTMDVDRTNLWRSAL
jgi:hypothetical protein